MSYTVWQAIENLHYSSNFVFAPIKNHCFFLHCQILLLIYLPCYLRILKAVLTLFGIKFIPQSFSFIIHYSSKKVESIIGNVGNFQKGISPSSAISMSVGGFFSSPVNLFTGISLLLSKSYTAVIRRQNAAHVFGSDCCIFVYCSFNERLETIYTVS